MGFVRQPMLGLEHPDLILEAHQRVELKMELGLAHQREELKMELKMELGLDQQFEQC